MILTQKSRLTVLPSTQNVARALAWLVVALLLLNALYFVLRASSPVIRDDSWYFLDVFLRKAINGDLGLGDFFVRRMGADHSQPLFKLVLLFEWRYLDLDLAFGAVVGVCAAAACALIFHMVIAAERCNDHSDVFRYLAWAAICAVLFTLNADAAIWTWPLVALENVTNLIILLFVLTVWHAHRTRRYTALVLVTLLLGITSVDSALIAAIAVVAAMSLMQLRDRPDVAVMELGMNHAGEISTLVAISDPDVRVWTNVGDAHLGFFESGDAIADAKAEILEFAEPHDVLICNADDPRVMRHVVRGTGRVLTFGIEQPADVRAQRVHDLRLGGR